MYFLTAWFCDKLIIYQHILIFCSHVMLCCQVVCSRLRNASLEVKQKILALFESMSVSILFLLNLFIYFSNSYVLC